MQRYDSATALVVVDVQNDFVDPAGSLAVGGAPAVLATINGESAMATSAGAFIVATQDWHPPSTAHFS
jgi:nicotinamidase/pyrazinamidase